MILRNPLFHKYHWKNAVETYSTIAQVISWHSLQCNLINCKSMFTHYSHSTYEFSKIL